MSDTPDSLTQTLKRALDALASQPHDGQRAEAVDAALSRILGEEGVDSALDANAALLRLRVDAEPASIPARALLLTVQLRELKTIREAEHSSRCGSGGCEARTPGGNEFPEELIINYRRLVDALPGSSALAFAGSRLGEFLLYPPAFAVELWRAKIQQYGCDARVLMAAAEFFTHSDRLFAQNLYDRARNLEPESEWWVERRLRFLRTASPVSLEIYKKNREESLNLIEYKLSRGERPRNPRPELLSQATFLALELGDRERALRAALEYDHWYSGIVSFSPMADFVRHELVGRALLAAGDRAGARHHLEQSAKLIFPQWRFPFPHNEHHKQCSFGLARALAVAGELDVVQLYFNKMRAAINIPGEWFDVWLDEAAAVDFSEWEYFLFPWRAYSTLQLLEDDVRYPWATWEPPVANVNNPYAAFQSEAVECNRRGFQLLRKRDRPGALRALQQFGDRAHDTTNFGPDLRFAQAMLRRGERAAVIECLQKWSRAWTSRNEVILRVWIKMIQNGSTPRIAAPHLLWGKSVEELGSDPRYLGSDPTT